MSGRTLFVISLTVEDWTACEGNELGQEVVKVGRSLWKGDAFRRSRMLTAISRYEGRKLASLDATAYSTAGQLISDGPEQEQIRWNLCQSLTDTLVAKIGGTQQPKVTVMASGADWKTRRKGPKLEQLFGGLWAQPQEPYADTWELGVTALQDAVICTLGAIKVWADVELGQVVHERKFPWELLVDPTDARYGRPRNLWDVPTISKAGLIAQFPKHAQAIRDARGGEETSGEIQSISNFGGSDSHQVVDMIQVFEWFSLPLGKNNPGKHVIAIDGAILLEEPWTRRSFPYALIRRGREFQGFYGRSLVEDVQFIDDEMNDLLARVVRTVRLTGMATLFVHEEDTSTKMSNADANTVTWSGQVRPEIVNPEPISPTHITLINLLKGSGYEFTGVNEQTATAQKQPGIESGAAIRLVADLQSERLSPLVKAYQSLYVNIAHLDVACLRELAKADEAFSVDWPGDGFLRSIKFAEVDLQDSQFTIRIAPAPGIKDTPADRLQSAQDALAQGRITPDAYTSIQRYLDLPGELSKLTRQHDILDECIEAVLDASEEDFAEGRVNEKSGFSLLAVRWMNCEAAILQLSDAYQEAAIRRAPDEPLKYLLHWIELFDAEITARAKRLAAATAPPAPPPGAAPPAPPQGTQAA